MLNSFYRKRNELPRSREAKKDKFSVSYCHQLNVSECWLTERKGESFIVNIYNPLAKFINKYIRVPVNQEYNNTSYNFRVIDSNGIPLLPNILLIIFVIIIINHCYYYFQLGQGKEKTLQLIPIPSFVASIPGRNSSADFELVFLASNVPPLGSKSYYIEVSVKRKKSELSIAPFPFNSSSSSIPTTDLQISNEVSFISCYNYK